jgi:hypothetical protein
MAMVGLVTGIALFALTSESVDVGVPNTRVCVDLRGSCACRAILTSEEAGFDPLTCAHHGLLFVCDDGITYRQGIDPATRVIPVPVGFLVGAAAAGLGVRIGDRRRRPVGLA